MKHQSCVSVCAIYFGCFANYTVDNIFTNLIWWLDVDRRWTATKIHRLRRERQKKTAACVKSMQISLNEQWPLNLNISMTIHMYRIVSWYVLTLYWSVQWISSQHQHRHTHTKIWTFQKCKTGRMYAPLQKVKRTNKRTISIQWRWDACFWSVRSIIFMILCVHENGMHHVSFKPNQTK